MKKLLAILLAAMMLLTLVACGNNQEDESDNSKTQSGKNGNSSAILDESVNWSDVESALDILESLKPEGWDENNYNLYIYDVYDSDALPDCIPEQIDGTLAAMTSIKDYKHDVLNQDYCVGPVCYESYEDYREYNVSFYAKNEHLEAFISELESNGMKGYMEGEDEAFGSGDWWEGCYSDGEWLISLFYNTNDDKDGEYDGCLTVTATDDLYDLPRSIAGIPLPQFGVVTFDYSAYYTIQDFTNGYEDVDFDIENDSFPAEYYAAWVDYYCVTRDDAVDYVKVLEDNGWEIESTYSDEEDYYCMILKKDQVYSIVKYEEYEGAYMLVGFSDMIENLTW